MTSQHLNLHEADLTALARVLGTDAATRKRRDSCALGQTAHPGRSDGFRPRRA